MIDLEANIGKSIIVFDGNKMDARGEYTAVWAAGENEMDDLVGRSFVIDAASKSLNAYKIRDDEITGGSWFIDYRCCEFEDSIDLPKYSIVNCHDEDEAWFMMNYLNHHNYRWNSGEPVFGTMLSSDDERPVPILDRVMSYVRNSGIVKFHIVDHDCMFFNSIDLFEAGIVTIPGHYDDVVTVFECKDFLEGKQTLQLEFEIDNIASLF